MARRFEHAGSILRFDPIEPSKEFSIENRPYFLLGDRIVNTNVGVLVGLTCTAVFGRA